MSQKNLGLFLDSGAYSAYSTGVPVNLGEYANFIKGLQKITDGLTVYANLDVIGDPEATLANQKQMEEWGLNPLPCFHCGEDFNLLKTYVKK